jgi:hypothetical protein
MFKNTISLLSEIDLQEKTETAVSAESSQGMDTHSKKLPRGKGIPTKTPLRRGN